MWFINWLSGFRWPLLLIGLGFVGISTYMLVMGSFFPLGWAMGLVFLAFSGKSSSEKKGYRF